MPEPEPAFLDAVSEHLSRCLPCRVEQEALREIDRRMSQLGQHRSDLAATVLDAAASSPGEPPSPPTLSPQTSLAQWLVIGGWTMGLILVLFSALMLYFRLR